MKSNPTEYFAGVFISCICLCFNAAAPASAGETILREDFSGPLDGALWTTEASAGNTVTVQDGVLAIDALENTVASIRRPLGVDLARASAEIRPSNGVSWCTSLFLYWSPGDWCQMGIIIRDGGRFYACEMVEGGPVEQDLGPCEFGPWQGVAIEAAEDCLRFLSRCEGKDWKPEILRPRPGSFKGPPAFVILGKGYSRGGEGYPKPFLANDHTDKGAQGSSALRGLLVERLGSDRTRASAAERREIELDGMDREGEEELARGEPTYESVALHFPAMKRPREAVSVKDHPKDIGIAVDGTLQFSDEAGAAGSPVAYFEAGSPPARLGTGPDPNRRWLLDGFLPVVTVRSEGQGLQFEETVFGWSEGLSPDKDLSAWARLSVRNPSGEAKSVEVAFRIEPSPAAAPPRWTLRIPPGASRSVFIEVPYAVKEAPAREIPQPEFERRLEEVRKAWTALLASGIRISVPEERVNNAWKAWLAWSFIDVDKKGEVYEPHDGSGFYELVYGYSAALCPNALDLYGFHADARRYLESLFAFQKPDGVFTANFGTPDSGTLLCSLGEHFQRTGDAEWLRKVAPRMTAMCDWIIRKRKESMQLVDGKKPATWGLIKFSPYCDFQTPCFDYFGDAYCAAGMVTAAAAFKAAGLDAEAERIAKEAALYRADILASMDAAIIERGGMRILPMEPETLRLLKDSRWRGGGYYGLIASCMLESGLLAPEDPRALTVMDFLRKKGGLILGMSEFAGGIDHAYTYGYWMNCLRRGLAEPVILGFYGSLAYGMSRGTFAGVEVTRLRTGDNEATLPHLYSCTQQLRLLRGMLLREEGGDLVIGGAIPRPWLGDGKTVEVERAPTFFGPLAFRIRSEIASGRIVARIECPAARPARSILLRLRPPGSPAIRGIDVQGEARGSFSGDTVRLDAPRGALEITVRY